MIKKYEAYQYYFLIGVISFVTVFFIPMLGSDTKFGMNLPKDFMGWIIFIISKIAVAVINMSLFFCFMEQAKINVRENERYTEANEILRRYAIIKEILPMGPDEWERKEYKTKGVFVVIGSAGGTFILTQAVLKFDLLVMLSCIFTIIMGTVFGFVQMRKAEHYWTEEFWLYAKMIERKMQNDSN